MVDLEIKMEEQNVISVEVKNPTPVNVQLRGGYSVNTYLTGTGPRGKTGPGLPKGGRPGQIPKKKSDLDYDMEFDDFDYNDLENKPSIEGVPLIGDSSFPILGLTSLSNVEIENLLTI